MKNTWIILALGCLCITVVSTSCKTAPQRATTARSENTGNQSPQNNQDTYKADVAQFRTETSARLSANSEHLNGLTDKGTASFRRGTAAAQKENNSIKKRLARFESGTNQAYAKFKSQMMHDIDALDARINELIRN